jgi:uncharacterized membrane protein SirB2
MIEFYPQIKLLHVTCALASVSVFGLRGVLRLAAHEARAQHALLRYASYAIDTTLLSAALLLLTILPGAVFANHWLGVKLGLLVLYIALGHLALQRAPTRAARAGLLLAALAVFGLMLGIARAHHPLGWWHLGLG